MQHPTFRHTRSARRRPNSAPSGSNLERFAVRFAELALLAGVVGAGLALLVARTA